MSPLCLGFVWRNLLQSFFCFFIGVTSPGRIGFYCGNVQAKSLFTDRRVAKVTFWWTNKVTRSRCTSLLLGFLVMAEVIGRNKQWIILFRGHPLCGHIHFYGGHSITVGVQYRPLFHCLLSLSLSHCHSEIDAFYPIILDGNNRSGHDLGQVTPIDVGQVRAMWNGSGQTLSS